jgi:hypothetical protein
MRQCVRQIGRSINFLNMASDEHTSGSSPNPVAVYCPIAGTFGGIPAGGAHYWRADVWARVSGVDDSQVQIRAA